MNDRSKMISKIPLFLLLAAALAWGCNGNGGSEDTQQEGDAPPDADADADADAADPQPDDAADLDAAEDMELPDIPGTNPPEDDIPTEDLTGASTPPPAGTCAVQGLDELCRRRDLAPEKPFEDVIDSDGWSQPETVVFHDTGTGAEIIRLTDDPAGNSPHCHINRSTFNADGSWIGFLSRRCWPGYYCPDNFRYIASLHGKGPHIISVPSEHMLSMGRQESWDPADPNVLYFVNHGDNNGFYRVTVDDGAFNVERLLELPNPDRRKHIYPNVGPDGTVVIKDTPVDGQTMNVYVWNPASPDSVVTFDLDLGVVHDDHSASEEWHTHDFTHRRNADNTIILNYGPEGSSGEPLFIEVSTDGSKSWRFSYAANEDTYCPAPYYSHPAWNYDGSRVAFGGTAEKYVDGTNPDGSPRWVWNDSEWGIYVHDVSAFNPDDEYASSTLVAQIAPLDLRLGHFAWDGLDGRWVHGAPSGAREDVYPYPLYRMAADGTATEKIADTYSRTRCTDDCDYCSLPRPAQSPDATKVLYTSDMLQAQANREDIYVALHRYPYAPLWLGLASETELLVTWRLHPSLSHEAAGVRLLRSADTSPPQFEDVAGLITAGSYLDDATTLADGESVLYAAVTVETSGVESLSLSRIIRVTRTGDGFRVDLEAAYGTQGFDATPPAAPAGLSADSPAAGQVRLTWTAAAETDVRVYHVYASPTADPETTQAFRIASLPADHPAFLDWSSGGGTMHYAVTAADYQGNESDPARVTASP